MRLRPITLVCLVAIGLQVTGCETGPNRGTIDLCPDVGSGEHEQDCPWAGIARSFALRASNGKPLAPALESAAPELLSDLEDEAGHADVLKLWGDASNFDEIAGAIIVLPDVVDFLNTTVKAPKRQNLITHAGVQHTYGYLFSLLKTSFGFKRMRWTQPDIERGLGLPEGCLAPLPASGTLLRNATFFGGRIALGDDDAARKTLVAMADIVTPELATFAFRELKVQRIVERIVLDGGRTIELRTDLLAFGSPVNGNTHVIVYSSRDSKDNRSKLHTIFPAAKVTVDGLLDPGSLGEREDLTTRYNAFVADVTSASFAGTRALVPVTPF